jgi:hypothetical protein
MPLQQYNASNLVSSPLDIKLSNVSLKQGQIFFNGSYKFNFSEILSEVNDVQTKNYSNFYLTKKNKLSNYVEQTSLNLKPDSLLTPIQVGGTFVSIVPLSGSNFTNYDYYFNLELTENPIYNQYFEIDFIDQEYCTISYSDGASLYYVVLDSGVCILKKSLLVNSEFSITGEQFFKYIINDDRIFLLKTVGGIGLQLASVSGKLSGVSTLNMSPDTFRENYFTISNSVDLSIRDKISTDYINYTNTGLKVDLNASQLDLQNNFLMYRNLDKDSINDVNIVLLKNQMSVSDKLTKGNNLAYYDDNKLTDIRNYTSIFKNINAEYDEGLELNYVSYNTSIDIVPGVNKFITGPVLTPFTQINVNDTTFVDSGAFAFTNPIYSDKIYYNDTLNDGTTKTYLCTWLSGSPYGSGGVWVDRYYYPDLITKRAALSSKPAFSTTYSSYLEKLISSNNTLSNDISNNYIFDKKSDLKFIPDTEYTYERFDINGVTFDNENIYGTNVTNYYEDINRNGGFTLQCTLVNQQTETFNTIYTSFKGIEGGVKISYNNSQLILDVTLYDQSLNSYKVISTTVNLIFNVDNSIILNVDSNRGILQMYLNGESVFNTTFFSQYYKLLYGDFFAGSTPLVEYVNNIADVYLTTSPLTPDELSILAIQDTINFTDQFSISLPCGMRNITDSIVQLNSIATNQKSKSNSVDLHISNLGITDTDLVNQIKDSLQVDIEELLPVNININQINILS